MTTPDQRAALAQELERVILWALGEVGEFPDWPATVTIKGNPKYWWRTELRKRYEAAMRSSPSKKDARDAARLDWIDAHPWDLQYANGYRDSPGSWGYRTEQGWRIGFPNARAAIDAALTPTDAETKG